jgi:hypothetical protein
MVPTDVLSALLVPLREAEQGGDRAYWNEVIASLPPHEVEAKVGSADSYIDTYRARLAWSQENPTPMVKCLASLVAALSSHAGRSLALVLIETESYTELLWLDLHLTRVVAHFRGVDHRKVEPKG